MNNDPHSQPSGAAPVIEKPAVQRPETQEFWDHRFSQGITPWDAGMDGIQAAFIDFARRFRAEWRQERAPRVLIPGCGSAYEAVLLADEGWDVTALDFSAVAIASARKIVGEQWPGRLLEADFFTFAPEQPFDVIYERAFLCALPRKLWPGYPPKMADLLKPGGLLTGFFYIGDDLKGPPFASTRQGLDDLLNPCFECLTDQAVMDSIALFAGCERWQVWRRTTLIVVGTELRVDKRD